MATQSRIGIERSRSRVRSGSRSTRGESTGHNVFFTAQAGAPADIDGSNANVSIQRTFAMAGTYQYTCHIHPSMHGTVVVQ